MIRDAYKMLEWWVVGFRGGHSSARSLTRPQGVIFLVDPARCGTPRGVHASSKVTSFPSLLGLGDRLRPVVVVVLLLFDA